MEVWEARRIDKILDAGRTYPLVVECIGPQPENTERRSFIVKALALPEIKETSLGFELVGNLLARRLGVDTSRPVLIRLSREFVEASRIVLEGHPDLASKGAKLLPGYGAGCEFLSPGFSTIVRDTSLTENELPQAARLCFRYAGAEPGPVV